MEKLTKNIVIKGQKMVMQSIDGHAWFLKPESMYEFQRRLQETPTQEEQEFEGSDLGPMEENLSSLLVSIAGRRSLREAQL